MPRLLLAYRSGIFPWTAEPPSWWSPNPRGVFPLDDLHISRSLARTLRGDRFTITFDRDFRGVITACAQVPRREGETWITPEFIEAYCQLHQAGHAHSVECWAGDELVGGVYGVTVDGLFAGESMFHHVSDASKVALVHLHERVKRQGFILFDTQMITPVTSSLGAVEITRDEYLRRLSVAVKVECRF
ncbi:MAG TPA: leucyl/phenylalanyl-tRNA--protein transferase [Candidatus Limnocylindria bacterium]|nr:leucyl/phenylalanyl-tRNA--protein transferase [Candidatus Limnocylindria bacterium]